MCNFPTVKDAADVAIATMMSGIQVIEFSTTTDLKWFIRFFSAVPFILYQVSRVELLDEVIIRALNMANGKNLKEVPTLMFEFIGTGEAAAS